MNPAMGSLNLETGAFTTDATDSEVESKESIARKEESVESTEADSEMVVDSTEADEVISKRPV